MSITSILAIKLAPVLAKSALSLWVDPESAAKDIGSNLIDLFAGITSDAFAQRNAARQFEYIGEKAAENLLPIFEEDGLGFSEEEKNKVLTRVISTFGSIGDIHSLYLETGYEPDSLEAKILEKARSESGELTTKENLLYERVLSASIQSIVEVASQLPEFSLKSFSELIKRDNYITELALQILSEVKQIRESSYSSNSEESSALYESKYKSAVLRKLDEISLYGAPELSGISKRHKLSVAYITLSAATQSQSEGEVQDEYDTDELPNLLCKTDRVLIRGLAGTGKTTLLQWIAVRAAQQSFQGELSHWNNKIPLFIRLRQCVDGLPKVEDWPGFVAPALDSWKPESWTHDQLVGGRGLVLIDGLDEVPQHERVKVREWVADICDAYPNAVVVITSRPTAIEEGWLSQESFTDMEMQSMSMTDINSFIEHWHEAVKDAGSSEDAKELDSLKVSIKKILINNRSIRLLASTPLLCALICALHRDRNKIIPSDRIELYDACVDMLVHRRDIERSVKAEGYPELSIRQKKSLLEGFAHWLMRNGLSMADKADVIAFIGSEIKRLRGVPSEVTSESVMRLLLERSGMLREPVYNHIDFAHRTFEEYFAAKSIVDSRDINYLIRHAHDDQWREVIILVVGIAPKPDREKLISGLIDRSDKDKENRHMLQLLAVSCLETAVELNPDLTKRVESKLKGLIPPRNMTDAKALASAGNLAVPYLGKKVTYSATTTAACVRALALIGTEAAFDKLKNYGNESRSTVIRELIKGWEHFEDGSDYLTTVLSKIKPKNGTLHIRRKSVEGLGKLENIRNLVLHHCSNIDFSEIGKLVELRTLRVYGAKGRMHELSNLKKLEGLVLKDCDETDFSFLGAMAKLKRLVLTGAVIEKISDLKMNDKLADVTLRDIQLQKPSQFLDGCGSLVELQVSDVSGSVFPPSGAYSLERFDANEVVVDHAILAQCIDVDELVLNVDADIELVDTVNSMPNLESLEIDVKSKGVAEHLRSNAGFVEINFNGVGNETIDLTGLTSVNILSISGEIVAPLKNIIIPGCVKKLDLQNVSRELIDLENIFNVHVNHIVVSGFQLFTVTNSELMNKIEESFDIDFKNFYSGVVLRRKKE